MVFNRGSLPCTDAQTVRRSACAFKSRLSGRNSVCTFVRLSMEGFTTVSSFQERLSSATQIVDTARNFSARLAKTAGTQGRLSSTGLGDAARGRDVYPCKKRGDAVGPTKSGKGSKAELLTDRNGTPLHVTIHSASPHEVKLIESLIQTVPYSLPRQTRLVYDKAADSAPLKQRLRRLGIRLICPYKKRRNRRTPKLSVRDRAIYSHRWKVERTFSWFKNFRRIVTRWERRAYIHLGFWQLACAFTILRRF